MNYVKQFDILGVDSRQTSCIELKGAPNAATEGAVGVLGIDITSPTRDVYKCVGVNGGVYTWMPISEMPEVKNGENGLSLLSAVESRSGLSIVTFPFYQLNIPNGYTVKVGDLILDPDGYIYQVTLVEKESCTAEYIVARVLTEPALREINPTQMVVGSYVGTGGSITLTFEVLPMIIFVSQSSAASAIIFPHRGYGLFFDVNDGINSDGITRCSASCSGNSVTIGGISSPSTEYFYTALYSLTPINQYVETVSFTISVRSYTGSSYVYRDEDVETHLVKKGTTWAELVNGRDSYYYVDDTTGYVYWKYYDTGSIPTGYRSAPIENSDGKRVLGSDTITEGAYRA